MANSRLPHDFVDSIIKSELGSQIRVLFWYIRNLYGWEKRLKKGYLEIKSYAAEAKKIGMHRQVFFTKIKELEKMGFFKIVTIPGTKSNSVTDISDKPCNRIQLHPVTEIGYNPVTDISDNVSPDSVTRNPVELIESSDSETLKQDLKQDLQNNLQNNTNKTPDLNSIPFLQELKNMASYSEVFKSIDFEPVGKLIEKGKVSEDRCYQVLNDLMKDFEYKENHISNPTNYYLSILQNKE